MSNVSLKRPEKYQVGSIGVSAITFEEGVQWLLQAPGAGQRLSVHFVTAHTVVEASGNAALRAGLEAADFVAPDGMPLVWAGKLQGKTVSRVYGPDTMLAVLDRGRSIGGRHYFYGGAPDVPARLAESLMAQFDGLEIAGYHSPPFRELTPEEDEEDVRRINDAHPDYVWIGLGSPKQDLWIAKHRDRLDAAVLLAVGAAFNFHTGDVRQAPDWMQSMGLEWLFRLAMEPRRLWRRYTVVNAKFIALVGRQAVRSLFRRVRS